jgi:hypothetical protein
MLGPGPAFKKLLRAPAARRKDLPCVRRNRVDSGQTIRRKSVLADLKTSRGNAKETS